MTAAPVATRSVTERRLAYLSLAVVAGVGVALTLGYLDSAEQDGAYHFLRARWAWTYRWMLVDVWGRPLFTFLYSLPAQAGYQAARLTTVAVCVATAWQTWRLAEEEGMERAWLAVALVFLQPALLALAASTMTEPLFALVFVIALRLHRHGHVKAGMALASLTPLARPEGFFLCALWEVWVLLDRRDARPWWRRLPSALWLAAGVVVWWLAGLVITRDLLFFLHLWPKNWSATGSTYGHGPLLAYWYQRSIIAGRLLYVPFLVGLVVLLARRRLGTLTSSFLLFFVLHSVLWRLGKLGSAGYARYFVCVAPATALVTLAGWNEIARALAARHVPTVALRAAAVVALVYSVLSAVTYVDSIPSVRDAWGTASTYARADGLRGRPVRRVVTSQAYMCVVLRCDPMTGLQLGSGRAQDLELLRQQPAGTLVFWDDQTGPAWYDGLSSADIAAAGYELVRSDFYWFDGRVPLRVWTRNVPARVQTMSILYKATNATAPAAATAASAVGGSGG